MPKKFFILLLFQILTLSLIILSPKSASAVGIGGDCASTANCDSGLTCAFISGKNICIKPESGDLINKINTSVPTFKNPIPPELQIKIPGLEKFSEPKCTGDEKNRVCKVYWIAEYISAIYKYAIGIVGILAAVVLMVGGIIWLTAGGNQTRIGTAKSYIGASIAGLVIALSSYLILYQINPELIKLKPITIGMVSALEEIQKQFAAQGCPTDEEKNNGFQSFITGYCRPSLSQYSNKENFLCGVGLNCSCPNGRSKEQSCSNSKGFKWSPCLDFDPDKTSYCNQTASGDNPNETNGIAADWSCFKKNSNVSIPGLASTMGKSDFLVVDQGSAIKGRRIDVWTSEDCDKAKQVTGTYTVYAK